MLANKYRPKEFSDVVAQNVCTKILEKQITNKSYSHAILFAGPAGCGKTTCARIFANKINGEIIELDCASHNGVADIKEVIDRARVRSLIYNYKVFILDECHTLSSQAWSSMLITLEENIPYSIFVFCTTDIQKIPDTIMSRLQHFNFIPISKKDICSRITSICTKENINISSESIEIIATSANNNLRQAITNLEKCVMYGELDSNSVRKVLNIISDDIMKDITNAYNTKNINEIISLIEKLNDNGYELHQFVRQLLDYNLKLHSNLELIDRLLTILQDIRYDDSPKNIIIARLIT